MGRRLSIVTGLWGFGTSVTSAWRIPEGGCVSQCLLKTARMNRNRDCAGVRDAVFSFCEAGEGGLYFSAVLGDVQSGFA